jgi:hypothetical protein
MLETIGLPVPDVENRRYIMMTKGLLMGDPLTKVILHLINIIVRLTASNICSEKYLQNGF